MYTVMLFIILSPQFGAISDRDNKAQRDAVIRRIAAAEWQLPPHLPVSPACRDLLNRILVPDPAQRLTMAGILEHPWFLADLPDGALEFNAGEFESWGTRKA